MHPPRKARVAGAAGEAEIEEEGGGFGPRKQVAGHPWVPQGGGAAVGTEAYGGGSVVRRVPGITRGRGGGGGVY